MNSAAVRFNLKMVQGLIESLHTTVQQGCSKSQILDSLTILNSGIERINTASLEHDFGIVESRIDDWAAKAATNRRAFGT